MIWKLTLPCVLLACSCGLAFLIAEIPLLPWPEVWFLAWLGFSLLTGFAAKKDMDRFYSQETRVDP